MSVRLRLTLWYAVLLSLSLMLFSGILYSLLNGIFINVLDDRLAVQAQQVIDRLQAESDLQAVIQAGAARLPDSNVFASQYYIQIMRADGTVAQQSENLRGQQLPTPAQVFSAMAEGRAHAYSMSAHADAPRLRVLSAPILHAGRPAGAVQVARSLNDLEESLLVVRRSLTFGSAVAVLLAVLGGVALSRAALRPIKVIAETAQQISETQDLAQRIPVAVPADELGRLSGSINQMLGRLERLFEGQKRLVANVSHELRTPLTTIQGNLDLLRRGAAEDPAMRGEAIRAIADETGRMRRILDDLLLLAQADAGLKLHLQPVELDTLLLDVYRQAQLMAQGVTVRLGAEDQALVAGDHDRLRQLLLNLVINALKYTPAGGQVTLRLSRAAGWVRVEVSDTGIGIGPEDLPHIFERFYRADRSRGRSGGSGLGLPIAQWIAEAHGGRIEVASQLGQGSAFSLWLPELTADTGIAAAEPDNYSS